MIFSVKLDDELFRKFELNVRLNQSENILMKFFRGYGRPSEWVSTLRQKNPNPWARECAAAHVHDIPIDGQVTHIE